MRVYRAHRSRADTMPGVRFVFRNQLPALLPRYEVRSLSYREVGATSGGLPSGYEHLRRRSYLGYTADVFERAASALLDWRMHRLSGLAVAARGLATEGSTVVLGAGRVVSLVIPCRVVYVVDEPHRQGFAYGTLTDHPEQGEELFMVTRGDGGATWLDVIGFSSPASRWVALAGPMNGVAQRIATHRYEKALAQLSTE